MPKNINKSGSKSDEDSELLEIEAQIRNLKRLQNAKTKGGNSISEDDLLELAYTQDRLDKKTPLIERIENKKGIFHYWYVKMPAQVLNLGSISESQRFVNDSIRSLSSPLCPICSKGILMYNLDIEPINGKVRWFCSSSNCTFKIWAPPATGTILMGGINEALQDDVQNIGKNRWESLTSDEKEELIDSHLSKALVYRNLFILMFFIAFVEIFLQLWWGVGLVLGLMLLAVAVSLKWCYRAWQIKTGSVFMDKSPFFLWLSTAQKYYSVDWVDDLKRVE